MVWTLGMDKCYRRSGFPKIPATQLQRWLLQPSPSLVASLLEKSHPWLCLTCLLGSRIRQLKKTAPGQICWHPRPFRSRGRRLISSCCSSGREMYGLSLGCVFPMRWRLPDLWSVLHCWVSPVKRWTDNSSEVTLLTIFYSWLNSELVLWW